MTESSKKKKCLYEILGVESDCDLKALKKSYRKLALKHHPDKNPDCVEEAQVAFREIQDAYEVLKDPKERQWYDDHRDQILNGLDSNKDEKTTRYTVDLMMYFSVTVFQNYDDEKDGFYTVYRDLFADIDRDEKQEDYMQPDFGNSKSSWDHVEIFYQTWQSFCTKRSFGWCDKYNPNEAPDRRTRRYIEKENKALRSAGKKKYNQQIRDLVYFLRRRDPRVKARREEIVAKQEKERREAELRELKLREEQRKRREEVLERERLEYEQALERGEVEIVEESVWKCEWCNKTFRSEKSFAQHEKSKKHKKRVAKLGGNTETKKKKNIVVSKPSVVRKDDDDGSDLMDALLDEMIKLDLEKEKRDEEENVVAVDNDDEKKKNVLKEEDSNQVEMKEDEEETTHTPPLKQGNAFSALMGSSSEEEEEEEELNETHLPKRGNAFDALMDSSSEEED